MHKLAMILCVMSVSLTAQWPDHPTPGLPRTPDGKPNLSAPVPRSADGKPDLSGVWMHETTSVAEVKRLFGSQYDADITLAPPGMEIGTQHKYAFDILVDHKPEEGLLGPAAMERLRKNVRDGEKKYSAPRIVTKRAIDWPVDAVR